ncbi:pyruvate decarboxylase [Meredithblackwellia eburnea MCA 4105]
MSTPGELKSDEIYLGNYLFERLAQLGVKPIFGVPGDFNLVLLDLLEDSGKVEWVGCCNELNASYAVDSYVRVKQVQLNESDNTPEHKTQGGVRGLGALVTTYGVGELSAMNGVAGAYAERVPFIHIVGVPSSKLQKKGALLHHTLGEQLNPDFTVYEKAAQSVTKAQAFLKDPRTAAEEIDRVLRVALETARPTYVTVPTDFVFLPVDKKRLDTPVVPPPPLVQTPALLPTGDKITPEKKDVVHFVVNEIERLWLKAKNPILLVDACAIRYGVVHLVRDLVEATSIKYFSTPMGKGALDEDPARGFGGVYIGDITDDEVKTAVESADLTILVGSLKSDFNTGEFSYKMKQEEMIELHSDHTVVQYANYPGVSFHTLLPVLARTLKPKDVEPTPKAAGLAREIPAGDPKAMVKQEAFWPLWGKFFKDHDIILAETGTSSFGVIDVQLPKGATLISQVLYGSIGYAGGALLGALKAAQESRFKRRTILFIGDGSLQLTVQDISTMLRQGLKPIIVVLNNDGYVIERLIHGPERVYNDISRWKWQELLSFFNADNVPSKSWLANTREEFEAILGDAEFAAADKCQLLEVKMDRLDAPRALVLQAKLSADLNAAV